MDLKRARKKRGNRGLGYIYALRYPIPPDHPRVGLFTHKKTKIEIDLDALKRDGKIEDLHVTNKKGSGKRIETITPEKYYPKGSKSKSPDKMYFARIPHYGILTRDGRIPPKYLKVDE